MVQRSTIWLTDIVYIEQYVLYLFRKPAKTLRSTTGYSLPEGGSETSGQATPFTLQWRQLAESDRASNNVRRDRRANLALICISASHPIFPSIIRFQLRDMAAVRRDASSRVQTSLGKL
jgi:hypothetical protein